MLCLHTLVDVVKPIVIDDLHCLSLSVTKLFISLWFPRLTGHLISVLVGRLVALNIIMVSHTCDCTSIAGSIRQTHYWHYS